MAKRKTNKSQAIRDYLEKNSDASVATVSKAVKAAPGLVYQVRAKMKGNATGGKRGNARRKRAAASHAHSNGSAAHVVAAAKLIEECGSVEGARLALRSAEQVAVALDKSF